MSKPSILAYTCCYGDRGRLTELVDEMRATAGTWFDWLVCLGAPTERLQDEAKTLLNRPDHTGFQYLKSWPENRGQHHATAVALEIARSKKYRWLLRLDDDVKARTKGWLKKMVSRLDELKDATGDGYYRLIAGPRIIGLRNQIPTIGAMEQGQKFPVEIVPILGGVCRLHPMELLEGYEPDLYAPLGRGDPESLMQHMGSDRGMFVRFPDIRMIHRTDELEGEDTPGQAQQRLASHYYPFLGDGA